MEASLSLHFSYFARRAGTKNKLDIWPPEAPLIGEIQCCNPFLRTTSIDLSAHLSFCSIHNYRITVMDTKMLFIEFGYSFMFSGIVLAIIFSVIRLFISFSHKKKPNKRFHIIVVFIDNWCLSEVVILAAWTKESLSCERINVRLALK